MIWASSWQHLLHPVPPWWALTLPVLFANLHPVDLCPRNSSLDALVFSYLLVFSRIPCGSHLLLLLRAFCVCSCYTPSALTACLPSWRCCCGDTREQEHIQTPHPGSVLPTDVSPESSYYSTLLTPDHLSWFWSLIKAGAQPERGLYLCSFRSWWIHASCSEVTGHVWNGRRQHW